MYMDPKFGLGNWENKKQNVSETALCFPCQKFIYFTETWPEGKRSVRLSLKFRRGKTMGVLRASKSDSVSVVQTGGRSLGKSGRKYGRG